MTAISANISAPHFGMWPFKDTVQVKDSPATDSLKAKVGKVISSDKFEVKVSREQSGSDKLKLSAIIKPRDATAGNVQSIVYQFKGTRDNYDYDGTDQEKLVLKTGKQKFVFKKKTETGYHTSFNPYFRDLFNYLNNLVKKREDEKVAQAQQIKELKEKQIKSAVDNNIEILE